MPYNSVADGFHIKILCSRLLQAMCNFTQKMAILGFQGAQEQRTMFILGSLEST